MFLGALVEVGVDLSALNAGLATLGIPELRIIAEPTWKNGFRATQIRVLAPAAQPQRGLAEIRKLIADSGLAARQKELAQAVFQKIGEAEARVHGMPLDEVHFHEVGAIDSIGDIVGAAIGWDLLGCPKLVASPVPTGTGTVHIAHGRCSIPAPATAELLRGIPLAESQVPFELTTPTGAGLLAVLASEFGPLPGMTIARIGCGAGERNLEAQPNLLRLFLGEIAPESEGERIWVLETNLDDVTGEVLGYCVAKLLQAGALDVTTTAIQMKKNRPGVTLTVLSPAALVGPLEEIVFAETQTLGLRKWQVARRTLARHAAKVPTKWGEIEGKISVRPGQAPVFSPEFESVRQVAEAQRVPLIEVQQAALLAYAQLPSADREKVSSGSGVVKSTAAIGPSVVGGPTGASAASSSPQPPTHTHSHGATHTHSHPATHSHSHPAEPKPTHTHPADSTQTHSHGHPQTHTHGTPAGGATHTHSHPGSDESKPTGS